jgi:hypothetical protein
MGECVKLPMRAKFSQTKQPKNTDPLVSEKWKADLPELDNFKKTIEYWRSNEISI